jgi:hypothetical protein
MHRESPSSRNLKLPKAHAGPYAHRLRRQIQVFAASDSSPDLRSGSEFGEKTYYRRLFDIQSRLCGWWISLRATTK